MSETEITITLPDGTAKVYPSGVTPRKIAEDISPDTYVNIMGQYRPSGRAHETEGLTERPSGKEMDEAVRFALDAGLSRLDGMRST